MSPCADADHRRDGTHCTAPRPSRIKGRRRQFNLSSETIDALKIIASCYDAVGLARYAAKPFLEPWQSALEWFDVDGRTDRESPHMGHPRLYAPQVELGPTACAWMADENAALLGRTGGRHSFLPISLKRESPAIQHQSRQVRLGSAVEERRPPVPKA